MAKQEMHSIIVRFAQVTWFPDLNLARQTGNYGKDTELKRLREDMARDGWWKNVNGTCEADKINSDWCRGRLQQTMTDRQETWAAKKVAARTDPSKVGELEVFEQVFTENGKLIHPTYIGITGNRRASQFFDALVLRSRLADNDEFLDAEGKVKNPNFKMALPFDDTLPITVKDYSNPLFRLEEQTRENLGKNQNFYAGGPVDHLLIAKSMLSLGANQNKLRTAFGASNGVRYYYLCLFNSKYPSLQIINRMKMNEKSAASFGLDFKSDFINITQVKYPKMQEFGQRLDPRTLEKYNDDNVGKKGFPMPLLTEKEVDAYLRNPSVVEDKGPKALDKNGIEEIAKIHDNKVVKMVAERIATNNANAMTGLDIIAPGCNILVSLQEQGDYVGAEKILLALLGLAKGKARDKAEKAIFEILGIE